MTVDLRNRIEEGQLPDLMELYKHTYWGTARTSEDVRKMLANTDLIFALVDDEHLVGFSRVLTDRTYRAFVFDVMVHPDRRGEGLARRLLDAIIDHPDLRNVELIELYCSSAVVDMYRKWGFDTELNGSILMRRKNKIKGSGWLNGTSGPSRADPGPDH